MYAIRSYYDNGAEMANAGPFQINTRGGRRASTARVFLRPALKRPNVRLLTHAQATRVLIESYNFV